MGSKRNSALKAAVAGFAFLWLLFSSIASLQPAALRPAISQAADPWRADAAEIASAKKMTGAVYVPASILIEYFDFQYTFEPAAGLFTITHRGKNVAFFIGTDEVFVDGRVVFMKSSTSLEGGLILLPDEAVDIILRQLFGKTLRWSFENGVFMLSRRGLAAAKGARVPSGESEMIGTQGEKEPKEPAPRMRSSRGYTGDQFDIGTIVIDPGHGGKDPGGIGIDGIKEKEIVLAVSKEIHKELKRRYDGRDIILTRDKDVYLSLEERSEIANSLKPKQNPLFVSIHANVSFDRKAKGYESYFLSLEPEDETARDVASMENSVLSFEMANYSPYLKDIINHIVDIEYRRESVLLAEHIQNRLNEAIGSSDGDRGVKSAFFYVLKAVKMPSVLVEIGFVTNKEEALKLREKDYLKTVVKGVADGIGDFISIFRKTEGFTK